MGFLANLLVRIGVDNSDLNGGMDKATRSVNKFATDVESAGKRLTIGFSLPMAALGLAAIKTAGEMEQTKVAFTTLMHSADAAGKHLAELKNFALVTPFQFQDLTKASRLMQAYGFSAAEVVPKLKTIGNAVSALGGGSELLERVVRSLGEIGTRGKVSGEQLRELSRAGIPALDAIAKKLGVSVAEAQKQITAGTVDAQTAMEALLGYMDTRFKGGMEAQAKTVLGSWSNIKDKITFTLAGIGDALLPVAKNVIGSLDPLLEKVKTLAEGFARLPVPVQNTTLALGGLATVLPLLTVALGATITNAIAISGAFSKLFTVLSSLAPLFTGPAGIIAGIAAVGAAGYLAGDYLQKRFGTGADAAAESIKRLNTEVGKSVLVAGMSHPGGSTMGGFAKWITDSSISAIDAMKKTAGSLVDIDKMLESFGLQTMATRKKNLADARELYAAVVKEYGAGSVIAAQALEKVNDALSALVVQNGKVKESIKGSFNFGEKGLESAVLVEKLKQLHAETAQFLQDAVKAGGVSKYQAQESLKLANALDLLARADEQLETSHSKKFVDDLLAPQAAKLPDTYQRIADALDVFGLAGKRADIPLLERNFDVLGDGLESGAIDVDTYLKAWLVLMHAMDAAGVKLDPAAMQEVIDLEKKYGGQIGQTRKEQNLFQREVTKTFDSVSRGIAKNIVDFKGFGATGLAVAKDLATGFLDIIIRQLIKPLEAQFAKLAGALGRALGIGGGAASGAASAAGGAASSAGGAVSGVGGAAVSAGLSATVGMVTGAISAVSSVIGNFQMAGMNKSLDVLVNHTLRIFNVVNQGLAEHYLFKGQLFLKMDDIWGSVRDVVAAVRAGGAGGKGSATFNNCTFNGTPQQGWMQAAFDQLALAQGA